MLEELTNLKIALQFTNERNSVIAKVVRLVVGFYPEPLTRPSIPSPCCSALKQPQSPGFFHFLLWACVYSAPDLGVLSPFPACWVWQFSTLLYTLWAFAFLLPLCQSQSQPPSRFWDFPGVPFIPGTVFLLNKACSCHPAWCVCLTHMSDRRSYMLHVIALVINIDFWYLGLGDSLSLFLFQYFGHGKDDFFLLYFCVNWTGSLQPFPSVGSGLPV